MSGGCLNQEICEDVIMGLIAEAQEGLSNIGDCEADSIRRDISRLKEELETGKDVHCIYGEALSLLNEVNSLFYETMSGNQAKFFDLS